MAKVDPLTPRDANQRPLQHPLLPKVTPRSAHRGITLPLRGITPRRGDWPGWPSPSWHCFPEETESVIQMFRAVQLHDVLLLARKQFHLDLIQVYLKGRRSIFKNVTGKLVVFSTIVSDGCVAQPRLFSS